MGQHVTPTELARELGLDRLEVIKKCAETGVPIFHGHIDRSLFEAALRASEQEEDDERAAA